MTERQSKVVVIGLDGATFTLLKPWMEEGKLPYLKSLVDYGVSGPLLSSVPPATSPAWQCFMTGKNPGTLGIAGFFRKLPNSYEDVPIGAANLNEMTLWEILSEEGKRLAVLNVPFTFPPPRFNGIMIGGPDTPPSKMEEAVYPPGLLRQIEGRFGKYQVSLKTPVFLLVNRLDAIIDAFLGGCHELMEYQFQVASYLLEQDEFDVVMFYQLIPDRIQHALWYLLDRTHPEHDSEMARKFYDKIVGWYQKLDEQIARLVKKVKPDPTVIVMSDHGFGPVHKGIDLNSWLLQEGYLKIKRRPLPQLRLFLWKLGWGPTPFVPIVKRVVRWRFVWKRLQAFGYQRRRRRRGPRGLFLSRNDIDWQRTKAYCLSGFGMLRLNLEGREPQGAVRREDHEALNDEIVAKLKGFIDPTTGRVVDCQIFLKEDVYQGKHIDLMPDIVYWPLGYVPASPAAFITRRIVTDSIEVSGFHLMDGVLIAKGRSIRKGATIEGASIMDLVVRFTNNCRVSGS